MNDMVAATILRAWRRTAAAMTAAATVGENRQATGVLYTVRYEHLARMAERLPGCSACPVPSFFAVYAKQTVRRIAEPF
jgi:hypothetical protein